MRSSFFGKDSLKVWRAMAGVITLTLLLSATAGAYTLVFRDGRRVETTQFQITGTTLTYELAPGFSRTVALVLIDVAATEQANHEAAGNFLKHQERQPLASEKPQPRARVVVTNRELKPIEQRRIQSEQAYEKRRLELRLPSVEETRRRQAEQETALLAQLRDESKTEAGEENYWRERARSLRTEIAAVDSQINLLRVQLAALRQFPLETHSLVISTLPLVPLNTRSAVVPQVPTFGPPPTGFGPSATPFQNIPRHSPFRRDRVARATAGFPFGVGSNYGYPVGLPAGPFDYVEDANLRADLSGRLEDLLLLRADLYARRQQLEDEARDARVPQIWLEP